MKLLMLALCMSAAASAAMSIELGSTLPSPQPVGTAIGLVPRVTVTPPGPFTYRYAVSTDGGPFRVVRDFSQNSGFVWAPELREHDAVVRVTLRNGTTKETADAEARFKIVSRVKGTSPMVTPTSHPLIALFSAPPCPQGAEFRVAFRRKGEESPTRTPSRQCRPSVSNNEYVAGMRADSDYEMRAEVVTNGTVKPGVWIPFRTGLLDGHFPPITQPVQRPSGQRSAEGIVVRSQVEPWRNMASDSEGNVIWYMPVHSNAFLTRVIPGGRFLVHADGANSVNDMKRWQLVREVDLLGNTIRETNISRLAEQLEAHGIKSECKTGGQQCVSGFHHEAIRLPNGHTLVLAGLERMMPAGTQGSKEPVDILGDLVLDLDEDFQLAWSWNSFDHMDLKRAGLGKGTCKGGPGDDGCPPVFLAAEASEWLHSNSLNYIASDGSVLISIPEQDWVVKIDYGSGKGSGKVLWRLGNDGDFTVKSDDPYPWFSFQHDAGVDPKTGLLIIFDDGHRRKDKFPEATNRGQAWKLDEASKTATLVMNADLGIYAVAVGSAQPLSDGSYSWESGFINPGPAGMGQMYSRTIETSPEGKVAYSQQCDGALTYRSFRVPDMYSAPRK
jgi:arylsulfate sulfotransferase